MTYSKDYAGQIAQDVKNHKVHVFHEEGSNGTQPLKDVQIAQAWEKLDQKVADTRAEYATFRENHIAETKKQAAINFRNITSADYGRAKAAGSNFTLDILSATDAAAQNVILAKLVDVVKLLTDNEKAAFGKVILDINDLLNDKAASRSALQSVINEVKNVDNPYEAVFTEAQALPTVIGEEYDAAKAEYEASLVPEEETEALVEPEEEPAE